MFVLKKECFFGIVASAVLLFSVGVSAEDAKYKCSARGTTGANFNHVFTASSEAEAIEMTIKRFGKEFIYGQVVCVKQ